MIKRKNRHILKTLVRFPKPFYHNFEKKYTKSINKLTKKLDLQSILITSLLSDLKKKRAASEEDEAATAKKVRRQELFGSDTDLDDIDEDEEEETNRQLQIKADELKAKRDDLKTKAELHKFQLEEQATFKAEAEEKKRARIEKSRKARAAIMERIAEMTGEIDEAKASLEVTILPTPPSVKNPVSASVKNPLSTDDKLAAGSSGSSSSATVKLEPEEPVKALKVVRAWRFDQDSGTRGRMGHMATAILFSKVEDANRELKEAGLPYAKMALQPEFIKDAGCGEYYPKHPADIGIIKSILSGIVTEYKDKTSTYRGINTNDIKKKSLLLSFLVPTMAFKGHTGSKEMLRDWFHPLWMGDYPKDSYKVQDAALTGQLSGTTMVLTADFTDGTGPETYNKIVENDLQVDNDGPGGPIQVIKTVVLKRDNGDDEFLPIRFLRDDDPLKKMSTNEDSEGSFLRAAPTSKGKGKGKTTGKTATGTYGAYKAQAATDRKVELLELKIAELEKHNDE